MKKFTTVAFLVLSVISQNLCAQSPSPSVEYMQNVFAPFEGMKGETWAYLKAVTRGKSARKVENKRQELISKLRVSKSEVARMEEFEEDSVLKKAVVDYLEMSYTVMKEDYDKILDLEDIAEQSYDLMEAYILAKEKAGDKLDEASDVVQKAQELYAEAHKITLLEGQKDKKDIKIDKANETLKYYNEIYLIFFKSYKQEAYVMEALSRGDVNALEQNISALKQFNDEGLSKLDTMRAFNQDMALVAAAKEMLAFYDAEAKIHFPGMTDFYIKKDNFEKVKKMMESKSKKEKTQEDVNKYNNAVEEFNLAVNSYNQTNEVANKDRHKSMNDWNKEVEKFFDKHN